MARLRGPWQTRVNFAPGGGFAYRPGEVLVRKDDEEDAQLILWELHKQRVSDSMLPGRKEIAEEYGRLKRRRRVSEEEYVDRVLRQRVLVPEEVLESFARFKGIPDTLEAVAKLNQAGIYAQPNHVLFAHTSPDPSSGFQANPFYANPFYANPFYANPFYANPFYANPFYANPFYANPFYANPFYANPNPAADPSFQQTGRRPSSARPGKPRKVEFKKGKGKPVVAILDTGFAAAGNVSDSLKPGNLDVSTSSLVDVPDLDLKGYLDPVAGHGTFIAGIIEQLVPGCRLEVYKVLEPYGDGDEVEVGNILLDLASRGEANKDLFVNMSFGGYSSSGMGALATSIATLYHTGATIVASAGNDGTSLPMYPAALPYVLSVGALDHEDAPAAFTNYGPWVRACTRGVEVVSTFFKFTGDHPPQTNDDIDDFEGWAIWSGTSFAAPRVIAALIHHMRDESIDAREAVKQHIDAPGLEKKPLLGTVVSVELE